MIQRKIRRRWLSAMLIAVIGSFVWIGVQRSLTRQSARQDAFEFILHDGDVSQGPGKPFSPIAAMLFPDRTTNRPHGTLPPVFVAIPTDRMTDEMVTHLLNVRGLTSISLYPRNQASEMDVNATVRVAANAAGAGDVPLSDRSMQLLRSTFPDIQIYVMQVPVVAPQAENTDLTP